MPAAPEKYRAEMTSIPWSGRDTYVLLCKLCPNSWWGYSAKTERRYVALTHFYRFHPELVRTHFKLNEDDRKVLNRLKRSDRSEEVET